MTRYLKKLLPEREFPQIQAALIFTNEKTEVEADNAPIPTLQARKLKELIRKTAKGNPISLDLVKEIQQALPS